MLRSIRKFIVHRSLRKAAGTRRGQAAVVMIFVIAIALVFFAVTMNFGHFSQIKSLVTVASNTSAGLLASYMSSYAQALVETQLGGDFKTCAWTGILSALITYLIIAAILTFFPPAAPWAIALSTVGLVLAEASLLLQIVVIQPGLTDAWNRIIQKNLSLANQFTEAAIQSALSKAVTDPVQIADVADYDGDGFWMEGPVDTACADACGDPSGNNYYNCVRQCAGADGDVVNRYGAYYTNRLRNIQDGPVEDVLRFLAALDEFLNRKCDETATWGEYCDEAAAALGESDDDLDGDGQPDRWGLHDHMDPKFCFGTAECHPCCQPDKATVVGDSGESVEVDLRPDDCDPAVTWDTVCGASSPYGMEYPWAYDPTYENPNNDFYSFRELLGKDDEHPGFYRDTPPADPANDGTWDPYRVPQNPMSGNNKFFIEDATNYYVPPHYFPFPPERRRGIQPFYHKLNEWGVTLPQSMASFDFVNRPRECHLCDVRDPACLDCLTLPDGPHPHPRELLPQLNLPEDPATLAFNNTYYVDGSNPVPGNPPLWVDKVPVPGEVIADENTCAEFTVYDGDSRNDIGGYWRPGFDVYCDTTWPYNIDCAKNSGNCPGGGGTTTTNHCACGEGGASPSQFPDDALDGMYLGLGEFIQWAEDLLVRGRDNPGALASNIVLWYPEAARWIEPGGSSCPACALQSTDLSEGLLHRFLAEMTEMRDRLQYWIVNQPSTAGSPPPNAYVGANCTEVWCVPPANCPLVQPDEELTFDANLNGVRGDIEDVIACLDWNATEGGGNASRFQACFNVCNACAEDESVCDASINDVCGGTEDTFLPRSLVVKDDGTVFDPNEEFVPVNSGLTAEVDACQTGECDTCYANCTQGEITCQADCDNAAGGYVECQNSCISNQTNCLANCPVLDPLNPNPYNICQNQCNAMLPVCMGSSADTCAVVQTGCETACNALDPLVDDIPACLAQCAASSGYCTQNNCDSQRELCLDACAADKAVCDGACTCTTTAGVIGCTPVDILDALTTSRGSCGETPDVVDSYLGYLQQSIPEATNQVAKFAHRRDFLQARLDELNEIVETVFNPAIDRFERFLGEPVDNFIQARNDFDPTELGLPYQAVYGWRDPDNPDGTRGDWHIVKVEARSMEMCDDACGPGGGPDAGWPWVRTYTKSFGLKRCYELTNYEGVVKFRVTRYDEERQGSPITFPNGEPIWQFRTLHPSRPQGADYNPGSLQGACMTSARSLVSPTMTMYVDGTPVPPGVFDGAFMMDKFRESTNQQCWDAAHELLGRGVMTETCAAYTWINNRMDFKFNDCSSLPF